MKIKVFLKGAKLNYNSLLVIIDIIIKMLDEGVDIMSKLQYRNHGVS